MVCSEPRELDSMVRKKLVLYCLDEGGSRDQEKTRLYTRVQVPAGVAATLTGEKRAAQLCREHQVSETSLSRWRQDFLENGPKAFESDNGSSADQDRIAELERLVGRLRWSWSRQKNSPTGWTRNDDQACTGPLLVQRTLDSHTDAYQRIGYLIEDVYQTKRIHLALDYLTPAEFEALYQAGAGP
jgi:transposase